jgi:hypothetical protein
VIASVEDAVTWHVMPSLLAGDEIKVYLRGKLSFTAQYDGSPKISDACAGRLWFTMTRGGLDQHWGAAATGLIDDNPPTHATGQARAERTDGPLTLPIALEQPLELGGVAWAATAVISPTGVRVYSQTAVRVGECPAPPAPPAPVARPDLAGAAGALGDLRRSALARAKQIKLPMTFSEAGSYRVRILAPGGRTLADGTLARSEAGEAEVTLTVKRRAVLERAKRVTLVASFTPAREGVKAQRASTSLRLR